MFEVIDSTFFKLLSSEPDFNVASRFWVMPDILASDVFSRAMVLCGLSLLRAIATLSRTVSRFCRVCESLSIKGSIASPTAPNKSFLIYALKGVSAFYISSAFAYLNAYYFATHKVCRLNASARIGRYWKIVFREHFYHYLSCFRIDKQIAHYPYPIAIDEYRARFIDAIDCAVGSVVAIFW
jgi:hypothetical protein